MANDKKNNEQQGANKEAKMTTSGKLKLVRAICQEYHAKLDVKAPKAKRDLNYTQVKSLMFLQDETKKLFKQLVFDEKIDPRDSLGKWKNDVIVQFSNHFKFDNSTEDVIDIQTDFSDDYSKWYGINFPDIDKSHSPSTIRVSDFMTYMGTVKKEQPLPNLVKHGVVDLTSWKLKDLKMEPLNSIREFFGEKKAS